jgi:indole-3-glycerol phosphate synthase
MSLSLISVLHTVEWSVAEKTAKPTSVLEGFMWDKETEIDRHRERVPLSNLISQCKLNNANPGSPRPRNWIASIKSANQFLEIPDLMRTDPSIGTIHKRYDVSKLVKQLTMGGAKAFSINSDGILYGGSVADISDARNAALKAIVDVNEDYDGQTVPTILASDLILYPYQLYKLYLSGADAVKLVVAAISEKDMLYLCKIASSLQLQTITSVTSEVQMKQILNQSQHVSINGMVVSSRNLEDYTYDDSGKIIALLNSETMYEIKKKFGKDFAIFIEDGYFNELDEPKKKQFIEKLVHLGVSGAFVV